MPSDNTYNNATAIAASLEQSRDPRTFQHAVADAFHHPRQPPQVAEAAFQAESLPCPRCDSKNTKFCYYNNYNLSQPRHFCKACRRYWTHGGTLRNIPVGGGTRRSTSFSYHSSNKRSRSSNATVSNCSSSSAVLEHDGVHITKPPAARFVMATGVIASADGVGAVAGGSPGSGFPSHLSMPSNNTFLALGEYGPGPMPSLDWFRFGFGQGVLPFAEAGFIEGGGYGSFHGPIVCPSGIETWHVGPGGDGSSSGDGKGGGEGGLMEGEGLAWPELAISMPGQGLK